MARGTKPQTTLLDVRVKMDSMPNPEVSDRLGTIKGVYLVDGRPMFIILIDGSGELVNFPSEWFKVLQ